MKVRRGDRVRLVADIAKRMMNKKDKRKVNWLTRRGVVIRVSMVSNSARRSSGMTAPQLIFGRCERSKRQVEGICRLGRIECRIKLSTSRFSSPASRELAW